MTFDARASGLPDDGRVDCSGGKDHAVARLQLEGATLTLQGKGDRAVDAVQDLLVAMAVGRVSIPRPVRP